MLIAAYVSTVPAGTAACLHRMQARTASCQLPAAESEAGPLPNVDGIPALDT